MLWNGFGHTNGKRAAVPCPLDPPYCSWPPTEVQSRVWYMDTYITFRLKEVVRNARCLLGAYTSFINKHEEFYNLFEWHLYSIVVVMDWLFLVTQNQRFTWDLLSLLLKSTVHLIFCMSKEKRLFRDVFPHMTFPRWTTFNMGSSQTFRPLPSTS